MDHQETVIQEIITWIDINIKNYIRINDVASRAGYSKWYFQRLFHQVTRTSLGRYIRDKKLDAAAAELTESYDSVMNIALDYGFGSQQSFTRIFTRKYGMPPGAYRISQRGQDACLARPRPDETWSGADGHLSLPCNRQPVAGAGAGNDVNFRLTNKVTYVSHKQSVREILNHALKGEPLREGMFAADFSQLLNGQTVTLKEFIQGTETLRREHPVIELNILSMADSADSAHSHHLVFITDARNEVKRYEVFARYDFTDGKAVRCYESLRELKDTDSLAAFSGQMNPAGV